MSFRKENTLILAGLDFASRSQEDLRTMARDVLSKGMHGLCFSIYEDGQKPGSIISESQVKRRIEIIKPFASWVRSFSCIEGNEHVPVVARQQGLKTLVGAWLGNDPELNRKEIEGLITLGKSGYVDVAAVGNEVMYRGDLSEDELLDFIQEVKEALPGIPVGYVDAYYEFSAKPGITEACDVILANCYPFWEGCHIDYSFVYMKQMYQQALHAAKGKRVIITETGWPSQGGAFKASEASFQNFLKYFINAQRWSAEEEIEMFYFASFDESWKIGPEGEVGAYWGLWDKNEKLKF